VALIVSSLSLRADAFLPCATPTRFLSRAPASLDSAARQGWRAANVVSVIMQDTLVCSAVTVDTKKIQERAEQELKKPQRIMIAGATGRVGRQVVQEVLKRIPTSTVVAVVRNTTAAEEAFDKVFALPN
jgi:FlaA1/EpsC-like NDP-sugar epimerase